MYAAAGGASLASRQKRKNQAAQNVKNKALLQQGLKDKLAASRASNLAQTPTRAQSRQFHNLPATYLRTPQAHMRKLSAGYTSQSKILVPINESNNQYFAHHHGHHQHEHDHDASEHMADHDQPHSSHLHHHHHMHPHHHHHPHLFPSQSHRKPSSAIAAVAAASLRATDHGLHFLGADNKKLIKSATASIPLTQYGRDDSSTSLFKQPISILTTHDDHVRFAIDDDSPPEWPVPNIVTPAEPQPSTTLLVSDDVERRCSFNLDHIKTTHDESKKLYDETLIKIGTDDAQHDDLHAVHATTKSICIEKWTDSECCDSEHQHSTCTCDHSEVKTQISTACQKKNQTKTKKKVIANKELWYSLQFARLFFKILHINMRAPSPNFPPNKKSPEKKIVK